MKLKKKTEDLGLKVNMYKDKTPLICPCGSGIHMCKGDCNWRHGCFWCQQGGN